MKSETILGVAVLAMLAVASVGCVRGDVEGADTEQVESEASGGATWVPPPPADEPKTDPKACRNDEPGGDRSGQVEEPLRGPRYRAVESDAAGNKAQGEERVRFADGERPSPSPRALARQEEYLRRARELSRTAARSLKASLLDDE